MPIRMKGQSPNGRATRVVDVRRERQADGTTAVCLWIHSGKKSNGWQINIDPAELSRSLDTMLISERW